MNASAHRLICAGVITVCSMASAPAFAITSVFGLADGAGLVYGTPAFQLCDTSPTAAADDGKIHYDSLTANGVCGGTSLPGYHLTFDVEYGAGGPAAVSGISGALYHITVTGLSFTNTSGQNAGPGDNGFVFSAGSPANFPDGVAKHIGVIFSGTADDNAGDSTVNEHFIVGGGIDVGGASSNIVLDVVGAVPAPSGSLPFSSALLSSSTYGIQGSYLYAAFYFNANNGDGFTLPGSFDLVVLGDNYTWSPVAAPVPLPASAWLMLSGLGGVGVLSRRRSR